MSWSIQRLQQTGHGLSLHIPTEPKTNTILGRIINVAVIALYALVCYAAACTSPLAVGIGFAGAGLGMVCTKAAVWLASQSQTIRESRLFPIIDDLVSFPIALGTLYTGTTMGMTTAKVSLLPALLCTLAGYYAPIAAYHEVCDLLS